MLQLPLDQLVLFLAQAALLVALLVRMWSAGLNRVYPYFFSYVVIEFARTLISSFMPYQRQNVCLLLDASESLSVCFYPLIVVELYRVILRDLPGIASISRRYITITVTIATVGSLFLLRLEKGPTKLRLDFAGN